MSVAVPKVAKKYSVRRPIFFIFCCSYIRVPIRGLVFLGSTVPLKRATSTTVPLKRATSYREVHAATYKHHIRHSQLMPPMYELRVDSS
jgi:hypothetical protein